MQLVKFHMCCCMRGDSSWTNSVRTEFHNDCPQSLQPIREGLNSSVRQGIDQSGGRCGVLVTHPWLNQHGYSSAWVVAAVAVVVATIIIAMVFARCEPSPLDLLLSLPLRLARNVTLQCCCRKSGVGPDVSPCPANPRHELSSAAPQRCHVHYAAPWSCFIQPVYRIFSLLRFHRFHSKSEF